MRGDVDVSARIAKRLMDAGLDRLRPALASSVASVSELVRGRRPGCPKDCTSEQGERRVSWVFDHDAPAWDRRRLSLIFAAILTARMRMLCSRSVAVAISNCIISRVYG